MRTMKMAWVTLCAGLALEVPAATLDLSGGDDVKTARIQAALDQAGAAGGGTVTIPVGRWTTDGLSIPSNVTLEMPEGAELFATTNVNVYANRRAFIYIGGVSNVTVRGRGRFYGNGDKFEIRDAAPNRAYGMLVQRSRNVTLEDFRLEAPATWTCKLQECDGIVARRLKLFSHANFNNDGIDIEAKNVLIEDCDIDTDDDALCFKSDNADFVCDNVEVRNCRLSSNCNAIKFGTGSRGIWRNIDVHDCAIKPLVNSKLRNWHATRVPGGVPDAPQCLAGIALEVVDGGGLENVRIRNIRMEGAETPIVVRMGSRNASPDRRTFLRDVLIENVSGSCLSRIASSITGVPGARRPQNITLRNVDLTMPGGATKEMGFEQPVPEVPWSYPENRMFRHILPAWGLYLRHVDGVVLDNVRLHLASADARPAAALADDVTGLETRNCSFAVAELAPESPSARVDPFIGTAGTANCFPNACVPHGFVQPGPSSGTGAWKYCGGYQIEDRKLYGFVQDAISGTGVCDFGDVLIQPFTGKGEDAEFRAVKANEAAWPGYYTVSYPRQRIRAEGTCSERATFWQFTYGGRGEPHLLLDFQWGHANKGHLARRVQLCEIDFPDDRTVRGRVRIHQWVKRDYHFCMKFNRPVRARKIAPREKGKGDRYVLDFDFAPGTGRNLAVKTGFSSTSVSAAGANLAAEIPHWHFNDVADAAMRKWNDYFARLRVEGTPEQKTTFYTSMWHLGIAPNNIADVGQAPFYSTLSLWDTFRAAHPLFTLVQPERVPDMVNSCFRYYEKNGFLPVWALYGEDNQCMIGTHSVPVMVDAYLKGFTGVDWNRAYAAIKDTLTNRHENRCKEGWDLVDRYGYYPLDIVKGEGVSRLLECAYDDWCAGVLAAKLGHADDAAFFAKRAQNYRNVFDKSIGLMRGRDTKGAWREPFDPLFLGHGARSNNDFTEGNAWQYTWHVQHDPEGLIALFGGKEPFARQLDRLFRQESTAFGDDKHDVTGLIGQYAHGNEPSHHTIYFFQYAGLPRRTAELVREVCDRFYRNAPDGLSGNDDCGQMSAWYLFSAMGFYPFNPCGGDYVLGAPQVPRTTLALPGGKTFTVVAKGLSERNKYVKSATLNGRRLEGFILKHADILVGGELVFEMCE